MKESPLITEPWKENRVVQEEETNKSEEKPELKSGEDEILGDGEEEMPRNHKEGKKEKKNGFNPKM